MTTKKIKNPTARIWTRKELKVTINQAKEANLEINIEGHFTEITNPKNGDIILRSLNTGNREMVRINKSYF